MDDNERRGNLALAPTGGFLGAVIGGVLWARFITQLSPPLSGVLTASIGIFCGLGVMLVSRERNWITGLTAAIFTVFGIFLGEYLQIRWYFISQIAEKLMEQNKGLGKEAAEEIARVQREGYSTWDIITDRVKNNIVSYIGTVLIGFLTAYSKTIYRFIGTKRK